MMEVSIVLVCMSVGMGSGNVKSRMHQRKEGLVVRKAEGNGGMSRGARSIVTLGLVMGMEHE